MKKYIVPQTEALAVKPNCFTCQFTSVQSTEQGQGQPQLAPKSTTVDF